MWPYQFISYFLKGGSSSLKYSRLCPRQTLVGWRQSKGSAFAIELYQLNWITFWNDSFIYSLSAEISIPCFNSLHLSRVNMWWKLKKHSLNVHAFKKHTALTPFTVSSECTPATEQTVCSLNVKSQMKKQNKTKSKHQHQIKDIK